MTDTKTSEADRLAAWPFAGTPYRVGDRDRWMQGVYDHHPAIRAFRDFRIAHTAAQSSETGWLIEHEDEPKWITLKPGEAFYEVCWTKDSLEALRFARREDADDYAETFLPEGPIRITEHMWEASHDHS